MRTTLVSHLTVGALATGLLLASAAPASASTWGLQRNSAGQSRAWISTTYLGPYSETRARATVDCAAWSDQSTPWVRSYTYATSYYCAFGANGSTFTVK